MAQEGSFGEWLKSTFSESAAGSLRTIIERNGYRAGDINLITIHFYAKSPGEIYADFIMTDCCADKCTGWYSMRYICCLEPENFSMVLECVSIYSKYDEAPGEPLNRDLIPYVRNEDFNLIGEEILMDFYPEALRSPCRIDGAVLAKRMKLSVRYGKLSDDGSIDGQIYIDKCGDIPADTILIDRDSIFRSGLPDLNRLNRILIHECVHYYRHRLFCLGTRLYDSSFRKLDCSVSGYETGKAMERAGVCAGDRNMVSPEGYGSGKVTSFTPIDWVEREANCLTQCIRMPGSQVRDKIDTLYDNGSTTDRIITELSSLYGVSRASAASRMISLGYAEAGTYKPKTAYTYLAPGTAGMHMKMPTYSIDFGSALKLYEREEEFRKAVDTGIFIFSDNSFCLSKHIICENGGIRISGYAAANKDKCCLRFGAELKMIRSGKAGILCSGKSTISREYTCDNLSDFDLMERSFEVFDTLKCLPHLPGEALKYLMKDRGMTVADLVESSGVPQRSIERYRGGKPRSVDKNNLLAICVGLRLEPPITQAVLKKYGVILTDSKEDTVYKMIMSAMYKCPVDHINETLTVHGLAPLSTGEN